MIICLHIYLHTSFITVSDNLETVNIQMIVLIRLLLMVMQNERTFLLYDLCALTSYCTQI